MQMEHDQHADELLEADAASHKTGLAGRARQPLPASVDYNFVGAFVAFTMQVSPRKEATTTVNE